jgi:hypothetical protein
VRKGRLRGAFEYQRWYARSKGRGFELTYEQWLEIWQASGHLHERGPYKGQYVMARFGDKGPYAIGNVEIITAEQNHKDHRMNVPAHYDRSVAMRAQISEGVKTAWRNGDFQNRKPRKPYKRKPPSVETRARISAGVRVAWSDDVTRAKFIASFQDRGQGAKQK